MSAAAQAADSPAHDIVAVRQAAERAPPPYPVRENGTRWVGRNSTEPVWAGVFTTPPRSAHVAYAAGRTPVFPQRKRVEVIRRRVLTQRSPNWNSAIGC